MTDHDIILKALDVYYAYPAEEGVTEESHAALDGLCADIKRGAFTAVIGHNGSGHSPNSFPLCSFPIKDR